MDLEAFRRGSAPVGPVQVDLVEAYAQGSVSRRDFVRRGIVIGLSLPLMSSIIAPAASSGRAAAPRRLGSTTPGHRSRDQRRSRQGRRDHQGRQPEAGRAARPRRHAGPRQLRHRRPGFEFLATLGRRATSHPVWPSQWAPNADGSVWTFKLRKGVKWQDGTDFTSADVAATMDRLVEAGNSGLKGVIDKGAVDASDPNTAVFNLATPNGNFPYLVSVFNAQTVITPGDYATGHHARRAAQRHRAVEAREATTPRPARRSPATTPGGVARRRSTASEFQFFDDLGHDGHRACRAAPSTPSSSSQVHRRRRAAQRPELQRARAFQAATHRQIWMRCDKGQFADKRVRQALAYTFDREQMIQTLFQGQGRPRQRPRHRPVLSVFFDGSSRSARRTSTRPSSCCRTPACTSLKATLHFGDLQEIPDLAQLIQSGAKEAGINLQLAGESRHHLLRRPVVPGGPGRPAVLRRGRARHRRLRPPRRRPTSSSTRRWRRKGIWNSSQYSSPEFDAAFKEYQSRGRRRRAEAAACKKIETILNEDVPVGVPYFYNYLSGHSKKFQGVRSSAPSARCSSTRPPRSEHRTIGPESGCVTCLGSAGQHRGGGARSDDALRRAPRAAVGRHLVAARHDRLHHRQRAAQRRRPPASPGRSRHRRPSTRSTSASAPTTRSSCSTSGCCKSTVTFDFGDSFQFRPAGQRQLIGRRSGARRSWPSWRSS